MVTELKGRATPILDVDQVFRFAKKRVTDVVTSFAGTNNDLELSWSLGGELGDEKTATFNLPAAASASLTAVEDGSNNAIITLASSAARTTTEGGSTWTVTDQGSNVWRFTEDTSWALSTTVIGDVVNLSGFDGVNNGTFRVAAVSDGSDYIDIISTDGLAEATISGTISIYPLNAVANTSTLVGAAIDALSSWTSDNADGNDGSGAITTTSPDFTIAGVNSNVEVYTLGSSKTTFSVPTVDGTITIKPGTKYLLRNITSILYIRLSKDDVGSADTTDIPIFVNESITFWSDTFNTLHANGTTGVLIKLG